MRESNYLTARLASGICFSTAVLLMLSACGDSVSELGADLTGTLQTAAGEVLQQNSPADVDIDRDGIPDAIEAEIGTDPLSIDSDGDGLSDHYESWGVQHYPVGRIGSLASLPDPNLNGIIAALDIGDMGDQVLKGASEILSVERIPVVDPTGEFAVNDVDGDGIPNEYELHGYYFQVDEEGLPYLYKWDGLDIGKPYYKTDPTQWSSDGDPFSDWEEATKINLDQRVKSPGDHPCIPAYPQLEAVLTSYSIEVIENTEIRAAEGATAERGWTNSVQSVNNGRTSTKKRGREGDFKVGIGRYRKFEDNKLKFGNTIDVSLNGYELTGGTTTTFNSSVRTNDKSGLSSEQWSTAQSTSTNTAAAARLILNMKVINTGTLPATNAKILFNLMLGDIAINSFVLNLEEYGELQPAMANPIEVVVAHDGRVAAAKPQGDPLELSLYQLRSLQMGAPLAVASEGFTADTLVWDVDPATGRRRYLTMGPWGPYESAIQNVSAHLILDFRRDPQYAVGTVSGLPPRTTSDTRVFCYRADGTYFGSPPDITLGDAFVWAFNAEDSDIGPVVTIRDPITGSKHTSPLALWDFGLDRLTIDKILANPAEFGNVFNLPLEPGNPGERIYTCSAPPPETLEHPQIYWATCNPRTRKIRAFSRDVRGLAEIRFKPDPDAVYDGELMDLGYSVEDGQQQFFHTYTVPLQYRWTGREQVVAINNADKRTVLDIQIEGLQLGYIVDEGVYGVAWDDESSPYSQGFNFDSDVISDLPSGVVFGQSRSGNGMLTISLDPANGTGVHDAMYVIDPTDGSGDPLLDENGDPLYTLDYNYLRKQNYSTGIASETVPAGSSDTPPLGKSYAVRTQQGRLVVIKPMLEAVPASGGGFKYKVQAIIWRTYEGI